MDKNSRLLNGILSGTITSLGHGDTLVIADAGLPIPPEVKILDLALVAGIPGFSQTLSAILEHLAVEEAIIAAEFESKSPKLCQNAMKLLEGINIRQISHNELKQSVQGAKLVVRTGECTPYANVILVASVTF
jgi:D-ribose pyranase